MNSRTLMIIGGIIFALILAFGIAFFLLRQGSAGPAGPNVTNTPQLGGPVTPSIGATMPPDAPQGDTFVIAGSKGGVTVKNFYTTAKGYAPDSDGLLIEQTSGYQIWYYRSNAEFTIALSTSGTTDDIKTAEQSLLTDLGVDLPTLCSLSVDVSYPADGGASTQAAPLDDCSGGGVFSTGN